MLRRPSALSACLLALCLIPEASAGDLFVDVDVTTGLDDGSSWANAFQGVDGLKRALQASVSGDRIFVAEGRYKPSTGTGRAMTHALVSGVEVYGNCVGNETDPAQRPPYGQALTVLDGDLGDDDGQGVLSDNSYHVVVGSSANASALLDGFEIRGGNANGGGANQDRGGGIVCIGGSPRITNCRFVANRCTFGGGQGYVNSGGAPTFLACDFVDGNGGSFGGAFDVAGAGAVRWERCRFEGNVAGRGGALEIFSTTGAQVIHCAFFQNTASGSSGGGGLWIGSGGTTLVVGCSVVDNNATTNSVAGLRNQGATVTVANCLLWANTGSGGQGAGAQLQGTGNVTYTTVMGGFSGTGNNGSDPLFVDAAAGDLRLTSGSPAVDSGNSGAVPAQAVLDLAGAPRVVDDPTVFDLGPVSPAVDRGAFELQATVLGDADPGCTPTPNSTGSSALLVAVGSLDLADQDLRLAVQSLPLNEFGYFLMSENTAVIPAGSGVLCLGGPQYRFNLDILDSGFFASVTYVPDLGNLPQGQVFQPGETWWFQYWHRDGLTSNFSNSLGFTWQ